MRNITVALLKTQPWLDYCTYSHMVTLLPPAGESVPVEEQFDKEKAKAEAVALDAALNSNDKAAPQPSLGSLPGVALTAAEKEKYEAEMAKLYKELDDKVTVLVRRVSVIHIKLFKSKRGVVCKVALSNIYGSNLRYLPCHKRKKRGQLFKVILAFILFIHS